MNKHLKYIDDTSDKFWQIEAIGNQFTVTYGKNGTSGVSKSKSFDTEEECLKAAEKLLNEKIKKGYSENGEVIATHLAEAKDKKDVVKKDKASDITAILAEYDAIIKQKDGTLLLPFLMKNTKGNLEPIRKHIKKNKKYWMSYVDLSLEPGYKKPKNQNWSWGIRGDSQISEIIILSALATFDKTDLLPIDEIKGLLDRAEKQPVLDILNWAKPKWIEFYLLDKFRKQDWISFEYKTLRFLEANGFIEFNPELVAFSLSRYNSWHGTTKPRDFIAAIATDEIAFKRDIPLLFEYECNVQGSNFTEGKEKDAKEFNTWNLLLKQLLDEGKLDRNTFIENALLIQTKEWNNNLKGFYRKFLAEMEPSVDELIANQESIFAYFNYSNSTVVNFGSELIKKMFAHPKFKTKSYLEWIEGVMMRSDCKLAVKNSLMNFEKISKLHPKFNAELALLIADVFIISDLNLQERAAKLILKIGNENDLALAEKLSSYSSYMQGTIKPSLSKFFSEDVLTSEDADLETYKFSSAKIKVLVDKVEIPQDWNEIVFLIGRFIASDEILDAETILNVIISQRHLFPADYTNQLQPYVKQLENTYFDGVIKNFIKNLLVNKIADKNVNYKVNDKDYVALNTLKLIKPLSQKVLQKNAEGSILPLLSFPTHKPYWVEPKVLLQRIIQYQDAKEEIDKVDLSIAISRMPRENIEEAVPLLDDLEPEMKDLMRYCFGVTNELKITPTSVFSKLFQKVTGPSQSTEKLAFWATASRTFHPNETFPDFEKTSLNDIPFVTAPFVPQLTFTKNWNSWEKDLPIEKRTTWMELNFPLPVEKTVPQNLIYNLDLHPKKEKYHWHSDYVLQNENNVHYWNSLMPQNNEPLACLLLAKNCKTSSGTSNELKGFITVANLPWFQFSATSLLVFACCLFQEKKEIRLLASEVLINLVENKSIDVVAFSEKLAFLISNKYGPLLRMVEGVVALKDISPLHNSALFILLDGIFKNVKMDEKLPTNFKKMVENFVDVATKTKQKPSAKTLELLDKYKENASLKTLIKQIAHL